MKNSMLFSLAVGLLFYLIISWPESQVSIVKRINAEVLHIDDMDFFAKWIDKNDFNESYMSHCAIYASKLDLEQCAILFLRSHGLWYNLDYFMYKQHLQIVRIISKMTRCEYIIYQITYISAMNIQFVATGKTCQMKKYCNTDSDQEIIFSNDVFIFSPQDSCHDHQPVCFYVEFCE